MQNILHKQQAKYTIKSLGTKQRISLPLRADGKHRGKCCIDPAF
jgi:hypothetical protein